MTAGPGGWAPMHSFQRDRSVTDRKLAPGTVRRIVRFAAPYRRMLVVFLVLIVFIVTDIERIPVFCDDCAFAYVVRPCYVRPSCSIVWAGSPGMATTLSDGGLIRLHHVQAPSSGVISQLW